MIDSTISIDPFVIYIWKNKFIIFRFLFRIIIVKCILVRRQNLWAVIIIIFFKKYNLFSQIYLLQVNNFEYYKHRCFE